MVVVALVMVFTIFVVAVVVVVERSRGKKVTPRETVREGG